MSTETTTQSTINVGGMVCSGCADTVQNALREINGVEKAKVNLDEESASVSYDANTVSAHDFETAIDDAGYKFKGIEN